MDEISSLITNAESAIDHLENFIFSNFLEKYVIVRNHTELMQEQIENITLLIHQPIIDPNYLSEAKNKLNSIIDNMHTFENTFKNGSNITVTMDENGAYVAKEVNDIMTKSYIEKANIPKLETTPDISPVEITVEKIAETPVVDTTPHIEALFKDSEPTMAHDSQELLKELETENINYNDYLDVKAVDQFLGQNEINVEGPQMKK